MTGWAEVMRHAHQVRGVCAEDHFTTSIDIGDHIARFVLQRCAGLGLPDPWIVDVGAGRGRLLEQLLALGFPGDRLLGVDVRPAPELPVHWIQGIAPECLPAVAGLVIAHEFLDDLPADVVRDGHVELCDGTRGPVASPQQRAWAERWGDGVCGLSRDDAWRAIVACVRVGEAIAVDYPRGEPVRHAHGRVGAAGADVSAGVHFASLRAATGGTVVPQHRLFGHHPVLGDRAGMGAFLWLFRAVKGELPRGLPMPVTRRIGSPA